MNIILNIAGHWSLGSEAQGHHEQACINMSVYVSICVCAFTSLAVFVVFVEDSESLLCDFVSTCVLCLHFVLV